MPSAKKTIKKTSSAVRAIRAVIFDLDDTLMDTSVQLVRKGQILAIRSMIRAGLPWPVGREEELREEVLKRYGPACNTTDKAIEFLSVSDEREAAQLADIGHNAYHSVDTKEIMAFPGTIPLLEELKKRKIVLTMITHGTAKLQNAKIDALGIRKYLDKIIISDAIGAVEKMRFYEEIVDWLASKGISAKETLSVGDRIDSEIKASKTLGMVTAQVRNCGRYSCIMPRSAIEIPDFIVKLPSELLKMKKLRFERGI